MSVFQMLRVFHKNTEPLIGKHKLRPGFTFPVKLLPHQGGTDFQVPVFSPDTEYFRQKRKQIPACGSGQVMVHPASLRVKIFRDTGINFTCPKLHGSIRQSLQRLISLPRKPSLVQRVCIHDCHMGESRTVFLFPIGKTEHPSQIRFQFVEVGIEAIATNPLFVQVFIRTLCYAANLFFRRRAPHNGKYLTGQHHAHPQGVFPFHLSAMVVVIAVKPPVSFPVRHPFRLPDMPCHPFRFSPDISGKLPGVQDSGFPAYGMTT